MGKKLIQITKIMKPGVVYTSQYLREKGYSSQLLAKYKDSGLIKSPHKGIYLLDGTNPTVYDLVYTLQAIMNKDAHISAQSALSIKGITEQLDMDTSPMTIQLNTTKAFKKPKWLKNIEKQYGYSIHIRQSNLFDDKYCLINQMEVQNRLLSISDIERAVFEMISDIKTSQEFYQLENVFESLPGLRQHQVKYLISNCKSIKVKRLMLYFSEKYLPGVFKELYNMSIDMGKGIRTISDDTSNTKYIKKLGLIIPKQYDE